MSRHLQILVPHLLSLSIGTAACAPLTHAHSAGIPLKDATAVAERPKITIESPAAGAVVQGVAIIRFRTENISIESPFRPAEPSRGALPAGHLHVTVDGAAWHWVHATSDPVVITPLPPGEHIVELELAGADHQPLDSQTVRFMVAAKTAPATGHPGHP